MGLLLMLAAAGWQINCGFGDFEPPDPILEITHAGDTDPWREWYNFTNIHSSQLCNTPGPHSCDPDQPGWCEGADPWDTVNVPTLQSMDSLLGVDDTHYERDRIMFFESCGADCREIPWFDEDHGTFRTGGQYKYREGPGPSYGTSPLLGLSVGHIRRYRRGACSAGININDHWAPDDSSDSGMKFVPGIRRQMMDGFKEMMECASGLFAGSSIILLAHEEYSEAAMYIGSGDCLSSTGSDRDYIRIKGAFRIYPDLHVFADSYLRWNFDIRFRLVAGRRSRLLDCATDRECEGCGNVQCHRCRTRPCVTDEDCCFNGTRTVLRDENGNIISIGPYIPGPEDTMPGTYCDIDQGVVNEVRGVTCTGGELGVCEKKSFLDVRNYGIKSTFERSTACKADALCMLSTWAIKSTLKDISNNSYSKFFATFMQAMYDGTWTPDPTGVFTCSDDSDCVMIMKNFNIDGRCGELNDAGVGLCEFRPMYFYGVNKYPHEIEVILAPSRDSNEYPQFTGSEIAGQCEPSPGAPGPNWGPMSSEWLH